MEPALTSAKSTSSTAASALTPDARHSALHAGVTIEIVTVLWMVVEAVVAIAAGILAGSLLLVAFGLDSVIELVSGGALLWRLVTEQRASSRTY